MKDVIRTQEKELQVLIMFIQYHLPYANDALEPHIDATTVETHHAKHPATYTKNLNDFAEKVGAGQGYCGASGLAGQCE